MSVIKGNRSVKKLNWSSIAEIIGLLSIVAGLLLVAWEVRQANSIARAEAVMSLTEQWNEFNSTWFENPEVARLTLSVMNPDQFEVSPVDRSRVTAMAWHFTNIFWTAQVAHENGLLSDSDIRNYQSDLTWMIKFMPGLNADFSQIYETSPYLHDTFVFEPIEQMLQKEATNSVHMQDE